VAYRDGPPATKGGAAGDAQAATASTISDAEITGAQLVGRPAVQAPQI